MFDCTTVFLQPIINLIEQGDYKQTHVIYQKFDGKGGVSLLDIKRRLK